MGDQLLPSEPACNRIGQIQEDFVDLLFVRVIVRQGSGMANGFALVAFWVDRGVVDPVSSLLERGAKRTEMPGQKLLVRVSELAQIADIELTQLVRRLPPDSVKIRARKVPQDTGTSRNLRTESPFGFFMSDPILARSLLGATPIEQGKPNSSRMRS